MPVTRKELALKYLRKQLASGVLKAGARLSDLALSKEMGISRTPVREAINNLVAEGFAVAHPHAGVFVASLSRDDVRELYELREALESFAAAQVAQLKNASVVTRLQALCTEAQSLLKTFPKKGLLTEDQRAQVRELDLQFHQCMVTGSDNKRIQKAMDDAAIHRRLFASMQDDQDVAVPRRAWRMHQQVVKAIKAGDVDTARATMAEHIRAGRDKRLAEWQDQVDDLPPALQDILHEEY